MNLLRYLLPLMVAAGFASATAEAAIDVRVQDRNSRYEEELNERDFDALREFVNTKRTLDIKDKSCNLTISGDVRTEWRHLTERRCGGNIRGSGRTDQFGIPLSRNDFDVEFNLRFDYVAENTWAVAHLQFDNAAGVDDNGIPCRDPFEEIVNENDSVSPLVDGRTTGNQKGDPSGWHGSGSCDDICLKKAYFGYNICNECGSRLDIEVGRRNLYNVFDSKVQFLSRFDGILFRYESNLDCLGDYYGYLAGFVVDERTNHFGWAAEFGVLNIMDYGFDVKYSFVDWKKNGRNACLVRNPLAFRFQVSQVTAYYHLDPEMLCMPAKVYGAFLFNHDAQGHSKSQHKRQDMAWYVGFSVGEVRCEGDWAFDMQYQYVEAQAVPDFDMSGIGRGNVLNESLTADGRGNTNFKGWRFEALYAVTDNLSIDTIIEWSSQIRSGIGGKHSFSKFELEAIYAF